MQLTHNEVMDVLDIEYFPSERTGFTLPVGIYEVSDIKKSLQLLLPGFVKVSITIDKIRLKSNLKNNQTLISTEKTFFYTLLGFTQSRPAPLGDIHDNI